MDSLPLNGYECFGKPNIPEPAASNPALPSELRSVLTLPTIRELWLSAAGVLLALQTTVSLVTLSAFERVVIHYKDSVIPPWIAFCGQFMLAAGEILIFGLTGQLFEIYVRKVMFYKCLQFGVVIDFKNVKTTKKYLNLGGIGILTIFIISLVLMWTGYSLGNDKVKTWSDALSTLIGTGIIASRLHSVMSPYLNCAALEDSLVSLPKFLEKDPEKIKTFLANCEVLPEQAIYARLCDLINIQRESWLRAAVEFARSAGLQYSNPYEIEAQVKRAGDKSQIAKFQAAVLEARKSTQISFSQFRECGEEGKEVRGAIKGKKPEVNLSLGSFLNKTAGVPKIENNNFVYKVFNSSKDPDSVLMGRYSSILAQNDGIYWAEEELNNIMRAGSTYFTLNIQFHLMLFTLLFVAFVSFFISGYNLTAKAS